MSEEEKLVTKTEAQVISRRFLLLKYPQANIQIDSIQLITKENGPVYSVQGKLTRRSRNPLDRFLSPTPPNQYWFKVELDAIQKRILHYEFH